MGNFNKRFMLAFRRTVGMTNGIVVAADWSIILHWTFSLVSSLPLSVQFSSKFFCFFFFKNLSFSFLFVVTRIFAAHVFSCTFTIILLFPFYCRCISHEMGKACGNANATTCECVRCVNFCSRALVFKSDCTIQGCRWRCCHAVHTFI